MESAKALTKEVSSVPFLFNEHSVSEIFPEGRTIVLLLDYDGTLSPIVSRPEDAVLSDEMKAVLEKCASKFRTAVISGRDLYDVREKVNIENIIYAGSHGFHIQGPGDLKMEHEKTEEILPDLDRIEDALQEKFSKGPEGVKVERKTYAIAVHYRNAGKENVDDIKKMVDQVMEQYPGMKKDRGKKIVEIKPDIDWHKGMAVKWILTKLGLWDDPGVFPVYIGDDVTDEDAFRILHNKGLGILVGSHGEPTAAGFRLRDVDEVQELLGKLAETGY